MNSHIYSANWNQELGTKIIWMTSQNISSAEFKLNPEHLGPISIQLNLQQDKTSIAFTANSAAVKEMLEASIPNLRDMLQTHSLNLAEVSISQHVFADRTQGQAHSLYFGQDSEGQKSPTGLENLVEPSGVAEVIQEARTLESLYA